MADALVGKSPLLRGEVGLFGLVMTVGPGCHSGMCSGLARGPRRFQTGPEAARPCREASPGGYPGRLSREAIQGGYPGRLSRELVPLEFLVGLHRHPVTLLIFGMTGVAGNVGKSDRVG